MYIFTHSTQNLVCSLQVKTRKLVRWLWKHFRYYLLQTRDHNNGVKSLVFAVFILNKNMHSRTFTVMYKKRHPSPQKLCFFCLVGCDLFVWDFLIKLFDPLWIVQILSMVWGQDKCQIIKRFKTSVSKSKLSIFNPSIPRSFHLWSDWAWSWMYVKCHKFLAFCIKYEELLFCKCLQTSVQTKSSCLR